MTAGHHIETNGVIVEPAKPICSRCLKPHQCVVAFMSRSARDGKPVMNRGAARTVRLCRDCARDLYHAVRNATQRKGRP